jgi:glycosyltransferase involved in cell wall biosynthesis
MHPAGRMTSQRTLKPVVDVTVVIPSIPTRSILLQRALQSVYAQSVVPAAISVRSDQTRLGAPQNRDLAAASATTEWIAFLDDDDELEPDHLRLLLAKAEKTGADLVYPWFTVAGGTDPFPQWENQPWRNDDPHQVPITFIVKRDAYLEVGGFSKDWDESQGEDPGVDAEGNRAGEDYRFVLRLAAARRKIVHLPKRTWIWHHHSNNTMGLPTKW